MPRTYGLLQKLLVCCFCLASTWALQDPPVCLFGWKDPLRPSRNECLLQDEAALADWPWTHRPHCVQVKAHTRYCVYTSATYGDNGISLVGTPETAANVVDLLDKPSRRQRFDRLAPAYDVVDIPGKGKGIVANRAIPAHSIIMMDDAAVVVDNRLVATADDVLLHDLRSHAVQQLGNPDAVTGLSGASAANSDLISAVLKTNSFTLEVQGVPHGALFPNVARINHACDPNSYTVRKPKSMSLGVVASRPIFPGEEITISYIAVGQVWQNRQTLLQRWKFSCTCSLCSATTSAIAASDANRQRLDELENAVDTLLQNRTQLREAIEMTHNMLSLLEEEGLLAQFGGEQYEVLARCYKILGEHAEAEKYAKMFLDDLHRVPELSGPLDPGDVQAFLESFNNDY